MQENNTAVETKPEPKFIPWKRLKRRVYLAQTKEVELEGIKFTVEFLPNGAMYYTDKQGIRWRLGTNNWNKVYSIIRKENS